MRDIHIRHEAMHGGASQGSIEELQARMAELQQIGSIGSWYYEPTTDRTWWSGEMYRLFGILPTAQSPTFSELLNWVHPADRLQVELKFDECLGSGKDFRNEFRIIRPDRVVLWIECRVQAKQINGLLRIEGTNQDITLRKQREIELLQSESRLRLAFDQMLEGFQVIDDEYRYVYLNHAAAKHGKKSREELIGRTMKEVYPGIETTPAFAAIQRCMVDRIPTSMESEFTYADQSKRMFELSIQPCNEGVMVLSFDVTDRFEAERHLVAKERELEAFFETSNVGMSEWRFDGYAVRANETCCRLLGYTREELLRIKFVDFVFPEDRPNSSRLLEELANGQINHYETHRRYIRKDGSVLHSQVYVTAIRNGDQRPLTFAVVLIDTTSQVLLEDQFRQSQKMEAVGRLAGGIAHDFNNLLTIVQTSSDVALTDPTLSSSTRDGLMAIAAAAKRGAGLTQQLLAFSRRQVFNMQPLDPNEVIRESSLLLHRVVGELVTLRMELEPRVPNIQVDRGQLVQVLLNLVANARDAVEPEGTICIRTRHLRDNPWGAVQDLRRGGKDAVEILVVDNGCGIREEVLNRIFEPFFTTKPPGKGTGLGLSVVHGVIDQFQGRVEVETSVGVGTTMRLLFPVVDVCAAKRADESPKAVFSGSETILIVDDEPGICDVCQRLLKSKGYQVYVAHSASQAIHMMESKEVAADLLLTDVVMPGMTGTALAEKLKGRFRSLRILFMSGYAKEEVPQQGTVIADGFVSKPFTADQLLQAVRTALEKIEVV